MPLLTVAEAGPGVLIVAEMVLLVPAQVVLIAQVAPKLLIMVIEEVQVIAVGVVIAEEVAAAEEVVAAEEVGDLHLIHLKWYVIQ